jgi:hypothetical protein
VFGFCQGKWGKRTKIREKRPKNYGKTNKTFRKNHTRTYSIGKIKIST